MIVYGDHARCAAPRPALLAMAGALSNGAPSTDAFVDAAALVQGLLDAEFQARGGMDSRSPLGDAAMTALTALARSLLEGSVADATAWRELAGLAPTAEVRVKLAEGFAFYALHPTAYARAARAARLGPDTCVIGVRSIGTGLAAIAAAAVGAAPPLTVRPVGDPFCRRLSLAPELAAELRATAGPVAVVDEGPGLSGSSFLSVAEALQAAGVGRERLVLLPSHDHGPGARAPAAARALWRTTRRSVIEPSWAAELPGPAADLTGPATAPPEDLSGGGWRALAFANEADWPAVDTFAERRKFRLTTERGAFLLKWAGLGADGLDKLARARRLAEAGFCPPVSGLREGWLVQPWAEGRPLGAGDPAPVSRVTAYLAFRAAAVPAGEEDGASAAQLAEMVRVNVGETLGPRAGAAAGTRVARGLGGTPPPRVVTDNRMHRHEWITTPGGAVLKTDALDHARGHDLIGAQEIGWDVAGASVEWDLTPDQTLTLAAHVGAPPERLPALTLAHLAFQFGAAAMAAEAHAHAPAEQRRLAALRDRHAERLTASLA